MRSYSCFFRSIGEEKYCLEWAGSLGVGGRVSDFAVGGAADAASGGFWHTWLSKKKSEGAQGIAAIAKVPGGPSRSSKKINEGKNKRVVATAIAKEPGSLKLRSGADVLKLRH